MINPMNLTGRKLLITGASRGIGKACAVLCAELGARIVLVARSQKDLDDVCEHLPGSGHSAICCDLQDRENIPALFEKALADKVKLSGMVHAAGVGPAIPLKVLSPELVEQVFSLNFYSFLFMVKEFVRPRNSSGGSVVGISSIAGSAGWAGNSLYAASKGAMDAAVRGLAVELAPRRYRINTVAPAIIDTGLHNELTDALGDDALNRQIEKQPLGLGTPADVANCVAFLLSDAGRFITGSRMAVDGGYLAQ